MITASCMSSTPVPEAFVYLATIRSLRSMPWEPLAISSDSDVPLSISAVQPSATRRPSAIVISLADTTVAAIFDPMFTMCVPAPKIPILTFLSC